MIDLIIKLIISHLIGDYVLQIDFIAKTKGDNIYHLLVHCFLYCVPFYLFFGLDWRLFVILGSHIVIDILKARYKKISYTVDQILHYLIMLIYVIRTSSLSITGLTLLISSIVIGFFILLMFCDVFPDATQRN